jgi:threonine/homoserine/homoserine lactone efflux protein
MDPSAALVTGLVTGLAIAMQIGAISLLLIETAVAGGTAAAVAAGMGVATVDLAFGGVAAVTGGAAGAALTRHEDAIRIVAAVVLAAIAIWGVIGVLRRRGAPEPAAAPPARGHYTRFVAMTAANPLTIASFAAVAAATAPTGAAAAIAFVAGIGAGSALWHLVLALGAGQARRWITGRARDAVALGGRVVVLAIAAHLALTAV